GRRADAVTALRGPRGVEVLAAGDPADAVAEDTAGDGTGLRGHWDGVGVRGGVGIRVEWAGRVCRRRDLVAGVVKARVEAADRSLCVGTVHTGHGLEADALRSTGAVTELGVG